MTFRWVIAGLLATACCLIVIGNAVAIVRFRRSGRRMSSVPLVGGIAGALAAVIAPLPALRPWLWVPLVVDVGCVPMLLASLIGSVRRAKRAGRTDEPPNRNDE